ncbi:flagellar P-ring protein FlgI [Candidatus Termititenax persephonae]|uniref:Flagellar P-ring protein n=1 Tax=Candidatus Termititenax persephonae TaxID=2218525 RepID=A0A388TFD3_9BACT|nr:flagellar P-ring protein FlgI [Candidatus Termititenax persephonae]
MRKKFLKVLFLFLTCYALADSPAVRIKDVATISGIRSNQLMGVGLVVGLKGTGDASSTFSDRALTNLLINMGLSSRQSDLYKSKNVAVVMVTAELPAFVKSGHKIDVFVSSLGDSTSLKNGNLLMTPLRGADEKVYAVASGPIMLGGKDASGGSGGSGGGSSDRSETVCKVIEGAIVEQEVPTDYIGQNSIALNLHKSDFNTATRIADALNRAGYSGTRAIDPVTVEIPIEEEDKENMVSFVARIQDFMVVPDNIAKVVINQRTGTVVVGETVRLSPVAVSHGEVEIRIEGEESAGTPGTPWTPGTQGTPSTRRTSVETSVETIAAAPLDTSVPHLGRTGPSDATVYSNTVSTATSPGTSSTFGIPGTPDIPGGSSGESVAQANKLVVLKEGSTLSSLVKALNSVGASPQDLIAILQALKTAGALTADIEVI